MRNRKFKFNGEIYTTMADIAREVGVNRIQPRDFKKYGIEEISGDAMVTEPEAKPEISSVDAAKVDEVITAAKNGDIPYITLVDENDNDAVPWGLMYTEGGWISDSGQSHPDVLDESAVKALVEQYLDTAYETYQTQMQQPVKRDRRFTRKLGTDTDIQEAKAIASTGTIDDFCSQIKHFTVDALTSMAVAVGINTWDGIDNEPIRKMRLIMGLKDFYFPGQKTVTKKVVSWVKVDLPIMVKLAEDNDLEFKRSDNDKIQRMWVTAALNAAGFDPADYEGKGKDES